MGLICHHTISPNFDKGFLGCDAKTRSRPQSSSNVETGTQAKQRGNRNKCAEDVNVENPK